MLGGTKTIETISKPVEIDIMQPALPRAIEMTSPTWYVVSEARIANRCNQIPRVDADGNPELKEDGSPRLMRPKVCDQTDREFPDMPEGYTKKDEFEDIIKEMNTGDLVFVALTISDYKILTENNQELVRWIRGVKAQEQYWLDITGNNPELEKEVEKAVEATEPQPEEKTSIFSGISQLIGGNKDD